MIKVTDPALIQQLEAPEPLKVTDPNLIAQLEAPVGFKERLQNDFNQRKDNLLQNSLRSLKGQSDTATAITAVGEGPGILTDIAGNAIGSAVRYNKELPILGQFIKGNEAALGAIGSALEGTAVDRGLQQAGAKVNELKQQYPTSAGVAGAIGNFAGLVPVGFGGKATAGAVAELPNALGQVVKSPVTGIKALKRTPLEPILSSEEIAGNARNLYKSAADKGGVLKPEVTNGFISKVEGLQPQSAMGKTLAGDDTFTQTVERIKTFKDKPIDLQSAQEIDEILGDIVDSNTELGRLNKQGKKVLDIQTEFRNSIDNAGEPDVTGGKEGFNALKEARSQWSNAALTRDLEKIITRAEMTDNPATSIKTGFRTLASNPSRLNKFPKEVQAEIKKAATSGAPTDFLRSVIGSRLISTVVGAQGGMAGAAAGAILSSGARKGASMLQVKKAENAIRLLQKIKSGGKMSVQDIKELPKVEQMEVLKVMSKNPQDFDAIANILSRNYNEAQLPTLQ